jgi:RNA polymerase sporulation-specific sigma factor
MSTTEEYIRLAQQGDKDAQTALVTENSGLIWSVAKRFLGRGTEADDLYQLGCLGFLKAVEGFDLEYGTQFSTYAVPKIAGEIRRFLRDDGAVKVSRTLKEQSAAIKSARNRLASALGREPTVQEIARQTGITPEQIALALALLKQGKTYRQITAMTGISKSTSIRAKRAIHKKQP